MNARQIAATTDTLRRVLELIQTGDLTASIATTHRIEGAVAALEAVIGDSSSLLLRLGVTENDRLV